MDEEVNVDEIVANPESSGDPFAFMEGLNREYQNKILDIAAAPWTGKAPLTDATPPDYTATKEVQEQYRRQFQSLMEADRQAAANTLPKQAGEIAVSALTAPGGGAAIADAISSLSGGKSSLENAEAIFIPASSSQAAKAAALHSAKVNPEDIYQQVKVFMEPKTGEWIRNIDDSKASLATATMQGLEVRLAASGGKLPLDMVLNHPEAMNNPYLYGIIKDTKFYIDNTRPKEARAKLEPMSDGTFQVSLGPGHNTRSAVSSILHELNHAAQERSGGKMSLGTNKSEAAREYPGFKAGTGIRPDKVGLKHLETPDASVTDPAYEAYLRKGGEAMSRLIQDLFEKKVSADVFPLHYLDRDPRNLW
jgi:hypothetical protein